MALNLGNIFAGIFGFFIGLVVCVALTPVILPIVSLIDDTLTHAIALFGFYAIIIVICIYVPIALATGSDEQIQTGNMGGQ